MGLAKNHQIAAEQCIDELVDNTPTVAALVSTLKRHGFGDVFDSAALSGTYDMPGITPTLRDVLIDEGWEVEGTDDEFTAADTAGTRIVYRGDHIYRG